MTHRLATIQTTHGDRRNTVAYERPLKSLRLYRPTTIRLHLFSRPY